ncbi:MAG: rhomboid family intrarane serine protease [Conexibacter sp.]|nr:rhomboid family intrarane serine protease [Conexibacter sp.]
MATCYRHSSRDTGVSCSNCARPICPDCMTPTSVGMRCPECAKQKTKVRTARTMTSEPRVTVAIIGICVLLFLATGSFGATSAGGNRLYHDLTLQGIIGIHGLHDYWRLITSGFLHGGLLHIGFNMYLLWLLGQQLEPALGSVRFGALYLTALLFGSFGALAQTTVVEVVGASGAVFGLIGALAVEQRRRGYDPFSGGLGGLLIINLVIGFVPGFHVAWGAHVGGLIGGVLVALAFDFADRRRLPWLGLALCGVLAAAAFFGAIAISGNVHDYSL